MDPVTIEAARLALLAKKAFLPASDPSMLGGEPDAGAMGMDPNAAAMGGGIPVGPPGLDPTASGGAAGMLSQMESGQIAMPQDPNASAAGGNNVSVEDVTPGGILAQSLKTVNKIVDASKAMVQSQQQSMQSPDGGVPPELLSMIQGGGGMQAPGAAGGMDPSMMGGGAPLPVGDMPPPKMASDLRVVAAATRRILGKFNDY